MIRFLIKGIMRDRNRSILPIIIVAIGVMLTVMLTGYMKGILGDVVRQSARFDTGHMKIMTAAYAENIAQLPNDLALDGVGDLRNQLKTDYPEIDWVERIKFGGLIDVLDDEGNSKGQGPVAGLSFELFSGVGSEPKRLEIKKSLVSGHLPERENEILISKKFADKLELKIGDEVSYLGSTMNESMAFSIFKIVGLIRFGIPQMDDGMIICDVVDAKKILDMEDAASEILGFLPKDKYNREKSYEIAASFNAKYQNADDEFSPMMKPLAEQGELKSLISTAENMSFIMMAIFLFAMSIVLWNTGLLAGLRRYKEFGIRLALGESKGHIYRTFTLEAVIIGIVGTVIGTVIGVLFILYLQVYGLDISSMMAQVESSLMLPTRLTAQVTPELFFIGFIPGLFAMVFGNMLSGLGIYKRETASLFKELES